jgi:hypothetical protein
MRQVPPWKNWEKRVTMNRYRTVKKLRRTAIVAGIATAGLFGSGEAKAISLDDIQLWTGSGTNEAALVIEWNAPLLFNNSTVPAPVANKTMVWGYRFNGMSTGAEMLQSIAASDPKLYVVANITNGIFITGIGYNLNGNGLTGLTDGTNTSYIIGGYSTNATADPDASVALNSGDLFWSGYIGPRWQVWTELGDAGGFASSPNRGASPYGDPDTGIQGQWESASDGLENLSLTNGSWIGFSVAAAGYDSDTNDPAYYVFNNDEQAPPSPDGTYVAYVCNTNDFAVEVVSTNGMDPRPQYNQPYAVLGRPTLEFIDALEDGTIHRTKIVDSPYWTDPNGSNVTFVVSTGGQITVKLGRKVYDDPNNPYGVDLIVFGNSYFMGTGYVNDQTDLDSYDLSTGIDGHSTTVSVSQDGTNWYAYDTVTTLFPQNAYLWDETNHSWTDEEMYPTKPLDPSVYSMDFSSQPSANELAPFINSAGGSGYNLSESGFPWIQYVRIQPGAGTYTVIDAIAAVNPVTVGDALDITPDDLTSGITNLVFQKPDDLSQTLISIDFDSVSDVAKISTVSLHEFSSFAPVIGIVSSAYQLQARPVTDANPVTLQADIGLRTGANYSGNGNDLRVFQWCGTNWISQPFAFNPTNDQVLLAGVTNFSAFVISQIVPPQLSIRPATNGFAFQFTPVPNCTQTLERSTNFITWIPITVVAPTNSEPVILQDTTAPAGRAFYRVHVIVP